MTSKLLCGQHLSNYIMFLLINIATKIKQVRAWQILFRITIPKAVFFFVSHAEMYQDFLLLNFSEQICIFTHCSSVEKQSRA